MSRWEAHISSLLRNLLKYSSKLDGTENLGERTRKTVFLDCGANLGSHALYAAALGFDSWAVEPQARNLFRVNNNNKKVNKCLFTFLEVCYCFRCTTQL